MKKAIVLFFVLLISLPALGQIQNQRLRRGGQNRLGIPQNQPPSDAQKELMKKKTLEQRQKFIADFVEKLEADEFQKEIIKSTLNDYTDKLEAFSKIKFESLIERQDAIKAFNAEHFAELKTLISESDMQKINDLIEGKKIEDDDDKKKKKKRRRNKDKG